MASCLLGGLALAGEVAERIEHERMEVVQRVLAHLGAPFVDHVAALMEAALRTLQGQLGERVVELLRTATSPRERLRAVLDGNFAPGLFTSNGAHVWMAFLGEVPFRCENAKLQHIIHSRLRSNLMPALRYFLPENQAEEAAFGLRVLIDGLWMQCAAGAQGLSREAALSEIDRYLEGRIPAWNRELSRGRPRVRERGISRARS